LEKYGTNVDSLTLLPSGGGVFEVTNNNNLIYSKKELDRFPDDGEIIDLIENN
jgi:selenoprotein W-related protein